MLTVIRRTRTYLNSLRYQALLFRTQFHLGAKHIDSGHSSGAFLIGGAVEKCLGGGYLLLKTPT